VELAHWLEISPSPSAEHDIVLNGLLSLKKSALTL